ncbi:MAG: MBL fold metallo-hydrolase [Proteobacteria bacterium]|nr:MBL fold metallo-hydrolase [Pseudomonadota bacterium]
MARRFALVLLLAGTAMVLVIALNRGHPAATPDLEQTRALGAPEDLHQHCSEAIGDPRVEEVAPDVFVAIGYDLANTIVVRTDAGKVVIDTSLSPTRAREVRAAVDAVVPGPVAAVIFTHSHIDHVGGADVWAGPDTAVWATDTFQHHFFEKYGLFREIENIRGARQFGRHLPPEALPCSSIGRTIDVDEALETGAVMPTQTFSGHVAFEIGGVPIELHEAPGETPDQLFVWLPRQRVLMPGDNYYAAFPNLYTIRGDRPRPVEDWINSLDAMRRLDPEVLVPSHTVPVSGTAAVRDALRDYRDAIQWVRDQVVRGANEGLGPDAIAARTGLPPALAQRPGLREWYGQIDWSVKAMYANELGWFDGSAEDLYPLAPDDRAARELALMGGFDRVLGEAQGALADGEPRWALELAGRLDAADPTGPAAEAVDALVVDALHAVGGASGNTNGRAYLLESAWERVHGVPKPAAPTPSDGLVEAIPLSMLFTQMRVRLMPGAAEGVTEAVRFDFDDGQTFVITVRNGVAETVAGEPLPGTPPPTATVTTSPALWRELALGRIGAPRAIATGRLDVDDLRAFRAFMARFDRSL